MSSSDRAAERQQRFERLCEEHGAFILDALLRQGVRPDVAEDLAQDVRLILRDHVEEERPLPNPRGFLLRIITYVVKNHKRFERRRPVAWGGFEGVPTVGLDPETAAYKRELWAKVVRYLSYLPEREADAVFDLEMLGLTLEEAAASWGIPRTTLESLRDRGLKMLQELARKSKRETDMGLRRSHKR